MKYRRHQTGEREEKTVWPEQEAGGPGHLEGEGRICPPWRRRRNGLGGCQGLDVKLKETGLMRQDRTCGAAGPSADSVLGGCQKRKEMRL